MKKTNEVSKLVGVSRRTLQYYDDEGLLMVERSSNNHRMYDRRALERIWEILVYKEMDFELREIKILLDVPDEQRQRYLEERMEKIRDKIMELKVQMRFVSLIRDKGIPAAPTEESGKTYVKSIEELREKVRKEIVKEE
ncbi:MAG TPA: MerR family transcriptional regulator [Candidatus Mediterraneibacter norfolkensis]|nr:MerR family transcriptional regulator [Candidatus Mediterraneibacter norfolkensis]